VKPGRARLDAMHRRLAILATALALLILSVLRWLEHRLGVRRRRRTVGRGTLWLNQRRTSSSSPMPCMKL